MHFSKEINLFDVQQKTSIFVFDQHFLLFDLLLRSSEIIDKQLKQEPVEEKTNNKAQKAVNQRISETKVEGKDDKTNKQIFQQTIRSKR